MYFYTMQDKHYTMQNNKKHKKININVSLTYKQTILKVEYVLGLNFLMVESNLFFFFCKNGLIFFGTTFTKVTVFLQEQRGHKSLWL